MSDYLVMLNTGYRRVNKLKLVSFKLLRVQENIHKLMSRKKIPGHKEGGGQES